MRSSLLLIITLQQREGKKAREQETEGRDKEFQRTTKGERNIRKKKIHCEFVVFSLSTRVYCE